MAATTVLPDSTAVDWRTRHVLSVFALFVAVSALTRAVVVGVPILNIDEASFFVGGRELLAGKQLYADFADNKPPLIYAYYALTQLLVGHEIVGIRWVTNLVVVPLTAFAASAFYRHHKRGIVAGLLYLVYGAAFLGGDMLTVDCELVMLLPLAWALVFVRDGAAAMQPRRAFRAGVFIGIAALVKYQAALWWPAVALAIVFEGWSTKRRAVVTSLVALVAGLAAPILATVLAFVAVGDLEGFLYWNVTHNLLYLMNPTTAPEILRRMVLRLLPFLVVTGPLWVGWVRSASLVASRYWRHLISGLILASFTAAFLGFRFFPHYFVQLYVPLALGAAPWIAQMLEWPLEPVGWLVTGYSLTALLGFTAANAALYLRPVEIYPEQNAVYQRVAGRLRADPCYVGGSVFVWGHSAPLFYFYAGLPVASRLFFPEFPLVNYFAGNDAATTGRIPIGDRAGRQSQRQDWREQHWNWLMADLTRKKPTYILDTAPAGLSNWQYFPLRHYPRLQRFVNHQYEPVESIEGVAIYRRRGCGT